MNRQLTFVFFVFISCLLFTHNVYAQSYPFEIAGSAKGFSTGEQLYLSDLSNGESQKIDSAKVLNNQFNFKVLLPHKINLVTVHTKGFSDYVKFWIDAPKTSIILENGNIGNAKIRGSETNIQQIELNKDLAVSKNENKTLLQFIEKNPNSIISARQLAGLMNTVPKDSVSFFYAQFSPQVKESIYGKTVSDFLKYNHPPEIGEKALDFEEKNLAGKNIKLSDYKGKILLFDFWGSWCVSCIKEQPNLVKLYASYQPKGFEILGVATETNKSQFEKAIQKGNLSWENLSDFKGNRNKIALMYGITYYPANFLIDKNGLVIAKDLHGEALEKKLKELFD